MCLLEVSLYVHPVSLHLSATNLAVVDVGQDLVLPDTDTSLLSVRHLVTVDQVDAEGEVPVVEGEAVRTFVKSPVTPLGNFLCSHLTTFLQ